MRSSLILAVFTALLGSTTAQSVVGRPFGFAVGATGGGNAAPQYPANIAQLTTWLTDSTPRVIVIDREWNFIGSEGRVTETGCRPASNSCPGNGGQDAINGANWCNGQPPIQVTYDKAGTSGIVLGSNKSIVGVGSKGVIRGKGLVMKSGTKNIIIQNIHITDLNPQYIWGGDAIQTYGADNIWIDHVKLSLIGRQMFAASSGGTTAGRITISNTEFDGSTAWSASCDNHHYWTILFNGSQDSITFAGNYVHHTSGRSPKVAGKKTILHAANNMFHENSGHAFDVGTGSNVVAEGNLFYRVKASLNNNKAGALFANGGSACRAVWGRDCTGNTVTESGSFVGGDAGALDAFKGYPIFPVGKASTNIRLWAGVGKL